MDPYKKTGGHPMTNYVFRRREQKYLLNAAQRQALEQAMAEHMCKDPYDDTLVCNVYYDTPDYRLIRHSLERPVYKEKLRLRSYGPVQPDQKVFLEMKKKYKGIVYKRRIALPQQEAAAYMADPEAVLSHQGQIGREIDYFKQFYGQLQPSLYLSYDRLAWHDPAGSDLRITLDYNVRYRTQDMTLTAPPGGERLIGPDQSLLEIKTGMAIPLWLIQVLSSHQIRKTSFSKYGTAYLRMLENKTLKTGGLFYA